MKIIKTLLLFVMSLFLVLSNISVSIENVEGLTLKSLTDQKVEYNDTVSFEFMERLEAPTPKQNGRGEPLENWCPIMVIPTLIIHIYMMK